MLNDALGTYTYEAENRIATETRNCRAVLPVPDEGEGGGDHRDLGMGADGAPMFEKLRVSKLLPAPVSFRIVHWRCSGLNAHFRR